jgi:hypothetical protein
LHFLGESLLKYLLFFLFKGFTYVAPSIFEEMQHQSRMARSPRRRREEHLRLMFPQNRNIAGMHLANSNHSRATPPHLQPFAPRPSPQDEMMEVQGLPIV